MQTASLLTGAHTGPLSVQIGPHGGLVPVAAKRAPVTNKAYCLSSALPAHGRHEARAARDASHGPGNHAMPQPASAASCLLSRRTTLRELLTMDDEEQHQHSEALRTAPHLQHLAAPVDSACEPSSFLFNSLPARGDSVRQRKANKSLRRRAHPLEPSADGQRAAQKPVQRSFLRVDCSAMLTSAPGRSSGAETLTAGTGAAAGPVRLAGAGGLAFLDTDESPACHALHDPKRVSSPSHPATPARVLIPSTDSDEPHETHARSRVVPRGPVKASSAALSRASWHSVAPLSGGVTELVRSASA